MKKRLCVLLVLLLLISVSAHADANVNISEMENEELTSLYSQVLSEIKSRAFKDAASSPKKAGTEEILFRKVPWGSTPADYSSLVGVSSLRGPSETSCYSWEWKGNDISSSLHGLSDSGVYIYAYPDGFSVAGIPVESVYAYFLYNINNELPVREDTEAKLYKAYYSFEAIDMGAAYELLKGKMEALYGTAQKNENVTNVWNLSGNDYEQHDEWYVWYGANNTGVYLRTQYQIDSVDKTTKYTKLDLVYGKTNSAEQISVLEASFAKEEMNQMLNNDSNDGL